MRDNIKGDFMDKKKEEEEVLELEYELGREYYQETKEQEDNKKKTNE